MCWVVVVVVVVAVHVTSMYKCVVGLFACLCKQGCVGVCGIACMCVCHPWGKDRVVSALVFVSLRKDM